MVKIKPFPNVSVYKTTAVKCLSFADTVKKGFKAKVVVCHLTYAAKQNRALGTSCIAIDFVPLLY